MISCHITQNRFYASTSTQKTRQLPQHHMKCFSLSLQHYKSCFFARVCLFNFNFFTYIWLTVFHFSWALNTFPSQHPSFGKTFFSFTRDWEKANIHIVNYNINNNHKPKWEENNLANEANWNERESTTENVCSWWSSARWNWDVLLITCFHGS